MKELKVQDWFDEIDNGLAYRKEFGKEETWRTSEMMFYGEKGNTGGGPNLFLSTGDALLSALGVPRPRIKITARSGKFTEFAPIVEAIDNWLMSELEVVEEVNASQLHAFLWGVGVLKVGYDSLYGYGKDVDPNLTGISMSQFDKKGVRLEVGGGRPGMPWVSAVTGHDIIVPWGVFNVRKSPWIANRIIRHIDAVKADKKYKNTFSLSPTLSASGYVESYHSVHDNHMTQSTSGSLAEHDKVEFVELYEIRDRRTRKMYTIASGHHLFLRNKVDQLQLDGLPFVDFTFIPRARNFWVTSDAWNLRQPQAELDDISLQASAQRRVSVLKGLIDSDSISEEEIEKLLSPELAAVIRVQLNGKSFKEIFQTIGGASAMNQILYADAEYVRKNARELVGFSRNQVGEFQGARTTATEVGEVAKSSGNRMGRRQNVVRSIYKRLFEKINHTIFTFWRRPMVVMVVGEDGAEQWRTFTGEAIAGDYALEVEFSEEVIESISSREQDALGLYSMLINDPLVDQPKLRAMLMNAINNPALRSLFSKRGQNANIPVQVSGVQRSQGLLPVNTK